MAMLRVIAVAMILFMISQNFYPHDRVLESQAWKKAVYAGGTVIRKQLYRLLPELKIKVMIYHIFKIIF